MPKRVLIATATLVIYLCLQPSTEILHAQENGADSATPAYNARFTGEILPVFYVTDVLEAVEFYTSRLGFVCHHFFDHETGESVDTWTREIKPLYAEMRSGEQKFAIHLTNEPDSFSVGGMIHYFGVEDVYAHRSWVEAQGVEVSPMKERPWMNMFSVTDPYGHRVYFFTRPDES